MKKIISVLVLFNVSNTGNAQSILDSNKKWSYHFQLTAIDQGHPAFKAKYSGDNSLYNSVESNALSVTSTLYIGRQIWKNAALYCNAEIAGGKGISMTKGIAGFTNGETFRIGDPAPALYLARFYFQQYFPLKNTGHEKVEGGSNQLEGNMPPSRITVTAGKFSLSDFFDKNKYSHDPRTQFMNWALMSNGAWDYPANTRGYTLGFVVELIKPLWAMRLSEVMVPRKANGLLMDYNISKAQGFTFELERSWKGDKPGAVRLLVYRNSSQAPTYNITLNEVKIGDSTSVAVYTGNKEGEKYGGIKYGIGINAEQEITKEAGAFLKASWNDGKTATWAFTEIDQSISTGLTIKGSRWNRIEDIFGIAEVMNGISKDHRNFLNAGLYGFIIGDGKLNYRTEDITEIYYQAKLAKAVSASLDYQFINNPAYNKDRGPVHVIALRAHIEL